MAIDIKVIPTLRGDEAVRFVEKADEVMSSSQRVDFSAKPLHTRLMYYDLKKLTSTAPACCW